MVSAPGVPGISPFINAYEGAFKSTSMTRKMITQFSLAINIAALLFFVGKRIYFSRPAPANVSQMAYSDQQNKGRESVLSQLTIDSSDDVFVGNSITEGFPLQEMFHNLRVKNRGIAGNRSIHIMERIEEIAKGHPAKIFLDVGINDILNNVPVDTLKIRYQLILNSIWNISSYTKIYVQSIFPVGPKYKEYEKTVEAFNTWLKGFCADANIQYIDLFPAFTRNGLLDPAYTYDDLHLTGAGYEVWKEKVQHYL